MTSSPARRGATTNVYWAAIIVTLVDVGARLIPDTVASYIDTMVIEEKYGFNRSTQKTFWLDQAKSLPISLLLSVGLLCLLIVLHRTFGDAMIVLFVGAVFIIELIFAFLSPQLLKKFNKFIPLEDGELRNKLTDLLEKNGYRVKEYQSDGRFAPIHKIKCLFHRFRKIEDHRTV